MCVCVCVCVCAQAQYLSKKKITRSIMEWHFCLGSEYLYVLARNSVSQRHFGQGSVCSICALWKCYMQIYIYIYIYIYVCVCVSMDTYYILSMLVYNILSFYTGISSFTISWFLTITIPIVACLFSFYYLLPKWKTK